MATSFNVGVDDVLEKTPHVATSNITSTSQPINTGMVQGFIDDASSEMAALVRKSGQKPDKLSDDAQQQVQAAVEAYAVSEILQALGAVEEKYRQYEEKWENLYDKYDKQHSRMDGGSPSVSSNVDMSDPEDHPRDNFTSHDYQF